MHFSDFEKDRNRNEAHSLQPMAGRGPRQALLLVLILSLKCTVCLGGELDGRRSSPAAAKAASPCVNVTEDGCLAVSGCAWCTADDDTVNGAKKGKEECMDWSLCKGPPGSCYIRRDEASCTAGNDVSSAGHKIGIRAQWKEEMKAGGRGGEVGRLLQDGVVVAEGMRGSPPACAWCKIAQRCVEDDPR